MDVRARILAEARRLSIERGTFPSLNDVARAAAVSKGGLMHHFPSRAHLMRGIVDEAIAEVDDLLTQAAQRGAVVRTWLTLSALDADDVTLFQSLGAAYLAMSRDDPELGAVSQAANARWERLLEAEVGDPARARVIRLVGDGMLLGALASTSRSATSEDVDAIIRAVAPDIDPG